VRRIAYQKGTLKTRKSCFLDLALPTLQNSGIFHNSTRPQKIITKTVVLVWPGAAHTPIAV